MLTTHSLQLHKSNELQNVCRWNAKWDRSETMLRNISQDERELHAIFNDRPLNREPPSNSIDLLAAESPVIGTPSVVASDTRTPNIPYSQFNTPAIRPSDIPEPDSEGEGQAQESSDETQGLGIVL